MASKEFGIFMNSVLSLETDIKFKVRKTFVQKILEVPHLEGDIFLSPGT